MSAEGKFRDAARELAPRARELAAAAERARRLSAGLSSQLADAGLYRLCVPASLGGGEVEPAELLGVVEELARGDGVREGRGACPGSRCALGA